MTRRTIRMWHDDIADEASDLIARAEHWRYTADKMAEAIRAAHDVFTCDVDRCRLCDALIQYKEARRG